MSKNSLSTCSIIYSSTYHHDKDIEGQGRIQYPEGPNDVACIFFSEKLGEETIDYSFKIYLDERRVSLTTTTTKQVCGAMDFALGKVTQSRLYKSGSQVLTTSIFTKSIEIIQNTKGNGLSLHIQGQAMIDSTGEGVPFNYCLYAI